MLCCKRRADVSDDYPILRNTFKIMLKMDTAVVYRSVEQRVSEQDHMNT